MKALVVLLFCFQLCPHWTESVLQDVACDNVNVFGAVDQSIRTFNGEKTEGNKFVLHRILEAQKNLENDPGTQYHVKYEIRESDCSVKSEKVWSSCDFNPSKYAATGICDSEVFFNKAEKTNDVVSQNCSIKQATPCLGCPMPLDNNSPRLKEPLDAAIKKFNSESQLSAHYGVEEVKNATSQVIAGIKYYIEFTIKETNCSKDTVNISTEDCAFLETGDLQHCNATVIIVAFRNLTDVKIVCEHHVIDRRLVSGLTPFARTDLPGSQTKEVGEKRLQIESGKRGKGHGHDTSSDKNGHRNGHREQSKHGPKKDKHEHKPHGQKHHKHDESSEEKHTSVAGHHPKPLSHHPPPPVAVKPKPLPDLPSPPVVVKPKPLPDLPSPPVVVKPKPLPDLPSPPVVVKPKPVPSATEPPVAPRTPEPKPTVAAVLPELTQDSGHEGLPHHPHQTVTDLPEPVREQTPSPPIIPILPDLPLDLNEGLLPFPAEHLPDLPDEPVSLNCPGNPWKPITQFPSVPSNQSEKLTDPVYTGHTTSV